MFALLIGTQSGVFRLGNDGNLQQEEGSSTVTFEVLIDLRCRLSHLPPRSPVRRQITDVPTAILILAWQGVRGCQAPPHRLR